jgi:F0F1-type ATP synthase membrane subunit b/b'
MVEAASTPVLKAALIDLDATYLVQMALFLTLFLLLRRFFFLPYADLLRRRDAATAGLKTPAKEQLRRALDLEAQAEERLARTRQEAVAQRRALAEEGLRARDEMVATERVAMQARLDAATVALDQEKARFRAAAPVAVGALAGLIQAQVDAVEGEAQ